MAYDTPSAATALAALGHEARLSVFRLLVRAGPEGLRVGDIAEHEGLAPSTLAHHLRALVLAGLVAQTRAGREVRCCAEFDRMTALLGFLSAECCTGVALTETDAA
ncbi:ArsR/SmtB family transcription factor [Jannaschia ovalis]|uniref:Metalloregulator ArsR/SmtB family transcription factor n=1 Tax=Jannaschia ovalis TaxID=3038773 RepID=A0ABY8L9S7_9RHOB|nr:metalloregulator ArsR/SmtB family transcription factor [Jannaschia sp. GRR-S6-38]WGH78112.1 metalloregulator ArsR/SmtB family transcription factor [Jannaschia sp. GRR-S6-38]